MHVCGIFFDSSTFLQSIYDNTDHKKIWTPPKLMRRNLLPLDKYSHIGRPNRNVPPILRRIEDKTRNLERDLSSFMKSMHKSKVVKSMVDNYENFSSTFDFSLSNNIGPRISQWTTAMQCAMLKLVNISSIDSRQGTAVEESDVLFNSGANCCITNKRSDFVGPFHKSEVHQTVDGLGKGLNITGKGTVAWTFKADDGMYRTLKLPCFLVPTASTRIALIQEILKCYPNEEVYLDKHID